MRGIILTTALILFASTLPAISATCQKYGPQGQVIYYKCYEPEPTYQINWYVTTTTTNDKVVKKVIKPDSVCYDYASGSIDYRGCMSQAKKLFKKKCDKLTKSYRNTGSRDHAKAIKVDKESYCRAARVI